MNDPHATTRHLIGLCSALALAACCPPGSSAGTAGEGSNSGGLGVCASSGFSCASNSDCCNGFSCASGRCAAAGTGGTSSQASSTGGSGAGSSTASASSTGARGSSTGTHEKPSTGVGATSSGSSTGSSSAGATSSGAGSSTGASSSAGASSSGGCGLFGCGGSSTGSGGGSSSGGVSSTGSASGGGASGGCSVARLYGNGGGILDDGWALDTLAVVVSNCGSQPQVTWTVEPGGNGFVRTLASLGVQSLMTPTDDGGVASVTFNYPEDLVSGGTNEADTVTASSGSASTSFAVTIFNTDRDAGELYQPQFSILQPNSAGPLLLDGGVTGQTYPGALVIAAYNPPDGLQATQPVANIGVRLADPSGQFVPAAAYCAGDGVEGVALTDSTGTATCDVVVTAPPGNYGIDVFIGETRYWQLSLQVLP